MASDGVRASFSIRYGGVTVAVTASDGVRPPPPSPPKGKSRTSRRTTASSAGGGGGRYTPVVGYRRVRSSTGLTARGPRSATPAPSRRGSVRTIGRGRS